MLIIQIALGIILAAIVLAFFKPILRFLLIVFIAAVIAGIGFFFYEKYQDDQYKVKAAEGHDTATKFAATAHNSVDPYDKMSDAELIAEAKKQGIVLSNQNPATGMSADIGASSQLPAGQQVQTDVAVNNTSSPVGLIAQPRNTEAHRLQEASKQTALLQQSLKHPVWLDQKQAWQKYLDSGENIVISTSPCELQELKDKFPYAAGFSRTINDIPEGYEKSSACWNWSMGVVYYAFYPEKNQQMLASKPFGKDWNDFTNEWYEKDWLHNRQD